MIEYHTWLGQWERETPSVEAWYRRFCTYQQRIDELVRVSPFKIIGVKYTGFSYSHQSFLEEPCLVWCYENLASNEYAEVFVMDAGIDGLNLPVWPTASVDAKLYIRAIMFQTEDAAAWFKLSCIDKVCDAYAWLNR